MIGWMLRTVAAPKLVAGLLIASAAGWGVAGVQTWRIDRLKAEPVKAENRNLRRTVTTERAQASAGAAIGATTEGVRVVYRERYRTITERIPVYVTAESDNRCPVPVGFVRLHDAAAAGSVLPETPAAAAVPNDAPSGVALSAVASTVVGNYAGCTDDRAKLAGLQAWVAQILRGEPAAPSER